MQFHLDKFHLNNLKTRWYNNLHTCIISVRSSGRLCTCIFIVVF